MYFYSIKFKHNFMSNYDHDVLGVGNPMHPANQIDIVEDGITLDEAIDDIRENMSTEVATVIEDHIYNLEATLIKTRARLNEFLPKGDFDVNKEIERNKRQKDVLEMIYFCEVRINSHEKCFEEYGRSWDAERLTINKAIRLRLINYFKTKLSC